MKKSVIKAKGIKPAGQVTRHAHPDISSTLLEILQAVTTTRNLPELLALVHHKFATILDVANFYVALYDSESDTYCFPYSVDEFDRDNDSIPSKMKKSLTDYVRRSGLPLLADAKTHQRLIEAGEVEMVGTPSPIWLGVPLRTPRGVIGVVSVQNYQYSQAYGKKEMELLQFLADNIAIALERKQNEEKLLGYQSHLEELVARRTLELENSNRQLKDEIAERIRNSALQSTLFRISEHALQVESMEEFYRSLQLTIGNLINTGNFYLALYDDENQLLYFPYFVDEYDSAPLPRKARRGLTEYVLHTGQPLLVNNEQIEKMAQDGKIDLIGTTANYWLGVPLKRGEQTFGVLAIQSYRPEIHYDQKDKDLLIYVSQRIAEVLWRRQAEAKLRESEKRFKETLDLLPNLVCEMDVEGNITYANKSALDNCGYTPDDLRQKVNFLRLLHADDRQAAQEFITLVLQEGKTVSGEFRIRKKDDTYAIMMMLANPIRKDDRIIGIRSSLTDITEQRTLEQQFHQAQKMESIGLLAGGIAHDFNNIIGGIMGYASLLRLQIPSDQPIAKHVAVIEKSAKRAADLTSKLLAFARSGKYNIAPASLKSIIQESLKIIGQTIDKSITIETCLDESVLTVAMDSSQMQQALINLCVNARDAMPNGGKLRIVTKASLLTENDSRGQIEAKPGWYAVLSVTDTGLGMAPEIIPRIFEPFFTTKEKGKGTGLGLAMVYGVVKNHGGFIQVFSQPGKGSEFQIYLPLSGKPAIALNEEIEEISRGQECILIIDDEETIRLMCQDMLESHGYRVLLAENGLEGGQLFREHLAEIDLVILDLIMPRMGGQETMQRLREMKPAVRILLATGYGEEQKINEILANGIRGYIQKPYRVGELLKKIRATLDAHE